MLCLAMFLLKSQVSLVSQDSGCTVHACAFTLTVIYYIYIILTVKKVLPCFEMYKSGSLKRMTLVTDSINNIKVVLYEWFILHLHSP